jgi:2-keto-4-pentenoate hydratase/2-oxohepta-3-ene-1,7-dioic acid hydratase in catechol pathway
MRIVRYKIKGKKPGYGILENDLIKGFSRIPFSQFRKLGSSLPSADTVHNVNEVKLLAPCMPSKIVCLGKNYLSHVEEFSSDVPSVPLIFLKPPTSVVEPDGQIILPRGSRRVDYEGELAVVIGRKTKDVSQKKAMDYILGYTCLNDVSERHNQKLDVQWTRAKGYDTFAPLGPWIETEVNPDDLKLETYLNGELRQSARTSDLIFKIPELIEFISAVMTLLPGDVIATGTTSGVGKISPGDVVEVTIEKIGTLKNYVVQQK